MTARTHLRAARLRSASFDADAYTIEIVWTTGAAVRRFDDWTGEEFDEVLSLEPGAVRLGRLNAGAPFIDTHDSSECSRVIGSVVRGTARIEGGKGMCTVLLSRARDVADIVQKIREGVIRNISVGYWQHKVVKTEATDGTIARWDVTDWEPLEISAVPVPADAGSQIRSTPGRKVARSIAPADRRTPEEREFDRAERYWARLAGKPVPRRQPTQAERFRAALGDIPAPPPAADKDARQHEAMDRRKGARAARELLRPSSRLAR